MSLHFRSNLLARSSLWFWCQQLESLSPCFLLLRFLKVLILVTMAFVLRCGPFCLETLVSPVWISNTCRWKHPEWHRTLSPGWDVKLKGPCRQDKLIGGLRGVSPPTPSSRPFPQPTAWHRLLGKRVYHLNMEPWYYYSWPCQGTL